MNARVTFVVGDAEDHEDITKKLKRIPLLAETKRKLFIWDSLVTEPVDWEKVRKEKKSIGSCSSTRLSGDQLEGFLSAYLRHRTPEGSGSRDYVAILVPGGKPDQPLNKFLQEAHRILKNITPKHQPPKIGDIEHQQSDVLRRVRARGSFKRKAEDHLVFTQELRTDIGRKRMKYLDGDTHFNTWRAPGVDLSQQAKIPQQVHDDIFKNANPCRDSDEEDAGVSEDVALPADQLIPFPFEHGPLLTQEYIHVFGVEIVVDFCGAAGAKMLAVLNENVRGVCVARNTAHKKFLFEELCKKVRVARLAGNPLLPAKPAEIALWERSRGQAQPKPAVVPKTPTPTPKPAVLPAVTPSPPPVAKGGDTAPGGKNPVITPSPTPTKTTALAPAAFAKFGSRLLG